MICWFWCRCSCLGALPVPFWWLLLLLRYLSGAKSWWWTLLWFWVLFAWSWSWFHSSEGLAILEADSSLWTPQAPCPKPLWKQRNSACATCAAGKQLSFTASWRRCDNADWLLWESNWLHSLVWNDSLLFLFRLGLKLHSMTNLKIYFRYQLLWLWELVYCLAWVSVWKSWFCSLILGWHLSLVSLHWSHLNILARYISTVTVYCLNWK